MKPHNGYTISVGDLVTPVEGDGTLMTVVYIGKTGQIVCQWTDADDRVKKEKFRMGRLLVVVSA